MANKTAKEKNKPVRKTLRENEYYNPKTKRYEYRYKDGFGKNRVVSSYRLEPTDQVPKGKKSGKSLREKEEEINALLSNDIDIDGSKLTLLEVVNRYLEHLYNRKELSHIILLTLILLFVSLNHIYVGTHLLLICKGYH